MFLIETLPVGPIGCNATVLADSETRDAVVIDPGDEAARILAVIRKHGLKVHWLLHTHGHFDHVGATRELQAATGAKIALHRDDLPRYQHAPEHAARFGVRIDETAPVDHFLVDGECIPCGAFALEVRHTPGHTPGGVSFLLERDDRGLLFAGDTLFRRNVGRTDLPGGDSALLEDSIRRRIYSLPDATEVICGHGEGTTVGEEKRENPFVGGA